MGPTFCPLVQIRINICCFLVVLQTKIESRSATPSRQVSEIPFATRLLEPDGNLPRKPKPHKSDADIREERLLDSQNTQITGNATALKTTKPFAGYRCVAVRLKEYDKEDMNWTWYELLDAPTLSTEPMPAGGLQNGMSDIYNFRTQILHSIERPEENGRPKFGQFDICFTEFLPIKGTFLQYEGKALSSDRS